MSKITLATVKSFIKKNKSNLFISVRSEFDGMIDGVRSTHNKSFTKVEFKDTECKNTLGIKGAWFVNQSRDWFTNYDDAQFTGISVSNSCGSFVLAIQKGK